MARGNSLYGKYRAAGTAAGKYQRSRYAQEGLEAEKGAESTLSKMRLDTLDQTVGAVSEALSLASSMYEGHKSKQEMGRMAKPVEEGGLGAVEQKQSGLDWLFGAEKEYKLAGEGEKIYKASDVRAKYQSSLYDEVNNNLKTKVPAPVKEENPKPGDANYIGPPEPDQTNVTTKGGQGALSQQDDNPTLAADVGLSNEADPDLTVTSNILGKNYAKDDEEGQGSVLALEPDIMAKKMAHYRKENWDPSKKVKQKGGGMDYEKWYDPERAGEFGWTGTGWGN